MVGIDGQAKLHQLQPNSWNISQEQKVTPINRLLNDEIPSGVTFLEETDSQTIMQLPTRTKVTKIAAPISVACVFATGGLGDKAFNDMTYAGLQKAQSDGLCTFVYEEPTTVPEAEGNLSYYAAAGIYDLIIAVGFLYADAVNDTAYSYPTQAFLVIDAYVVQGNVSSTLFKHHEGSFLAGALAGLMTNTGRIGFIGGMDIPLIREFWAGYSAGAFYERNNSYIQVFEDYVGSWGDPETARIQADMMWQHGVDIIFAAAGASGNGVLEFANENPGVFAIGVDGDQDYLFPGDILTSVMKRTDIAVYRAIQDIYNENWNPDTKVLGLVEDGVGLSPMTYTKDLIGEEIIEEVNVTVRNKIVSGVITVPNDTVRLNQWMTAMNIVNNSYTSHDPISITNSAQFTMLGFAGTGTWNDPFRIEGLYIFDTGGTLIEINGITDYYQIRDNLLNGFNTAGQGMFITNSRNGNISNNAIIKTGDGIRLEYSINHTITDIAIFNNSYGIILDSSSNLNNVSHNTISHSYWDGIAIGGVGGSHNNTISHNTIYKNRDAGMRLSDSTENLIIENVIIDNGVGISLGASNDNEIMFNNISKCKWDGVGLYLSNYTTIMDNHIFGNGGLGIVITGPSKSTLIAVNRIYDNHGTGIELGDSIGCTVDTNEVYNHSNGNGIAIGFDGMVQESPSDHQIINNEIYNCRYRGIRVEFSEGNLIAGNTVYRNGEDGIWLWECMNNVLTGNTVYNNTWQGILIEGSTDNLIEGNTIYGNIGGTGICLIGYSMDNIITDNNIHDNVNGSGGSFFGFYNGIWFDDFSGYNSILNNNIYFQSISQEWSCWGIALASSYNKISFNMIYNAEFAIQFVSSDCINNFIFKNTIFDNINGIMVDGRINEIVRNTVHDNNIGISVKGVYNLIDSNIVYNHDDSGIALISANHNIISSNDVYNNAMNGINLGGSYYNNIYNNTIGNNPNEGLYLENSDYNIIKWNHFIQGPSANDAGFGNVFILNYWYSWTSPDADGDGIVDNPYSIGAENQDPYPLVSPGIHALTPPVVSYPDSGKVLSGTITIQWEPSVDSYDHSSTYDVYYSIDGDTWILLTSDLTTTKYEWDTEDVPDGSTYKIKVLATCSLGYSNEATSEGTFSIQNDVPTTSTTPTSSSQVSTSGAPDIGTPGMTTVIAFLALLPLLIMNKVRRKRREHE
ncbi:MAG: BMP family ABC transporter substrate-binding protein [Candidatus Hodarchaeota archaeon]